jgi:hypothetical protein
VNAGVYQARKQVVARAVDHGGALRDVDRIGWADRRDPVSSHHNRSTSVDTLGVHRDHIDVDEGDDPLLRERRARRSASYVEADPN